LLTGKIVDKSACAIATCVTSLNGVPLYMNGDQHHLNFIGSEGIGKVYLGKLGNPFPTLDNL